VPAGLLCPQAEKSAFVETKHGYGLKLPFLTADFQITPILQIVRTGNFVVEFGKKKR